MEKEEAIFVGKVRTKEERDKLGKEVAKAAMAFCDKSIIWTADTIKKVK